MKQNKAYKFILDLIFPNRCGFCHKVVPWDKLICHECEEKLEYSSEPVRYDSDGAFDRCVSPCGYFGVAKNGVLNLKYHYGKNTAEYLLPCLCGLIREHLPVADIDIVTSVPMTKKRRSETGYNHAEVIAKLICDELKLPYDPKLLEKQKVASVQHKLSASDRKTLIKGVYKRGKSLYNIKDKTVLLVDDIITTGATLSECATILKEEGASAVYCVTLAKSIKNL